jgi:hypothetical protein
MKNEAQELVSPLGVWFALAAISFGLERTLRGRNFGTLPI